MGYNISNLKLKVTYYSRVSTDHQEQEKSLNNQIEHFDKMIKQNENWEYIDGYIDKGITGISDIKRNSFMKMIDDAKKQKFDLIITKEISRFSRNTLDSIKYTRELLEHGVAVLFLNDNINTIFPDSELRLTIMASMAQDEIRRLSERVKFGMRRAQERGNILGNNMLYGYHKKNDRLKIIKEEAIVVKKIYNMYVLDNISLTKIKDILNEQNIKTRQNNKWNTSQISRIITNPKYKGYYCGRKKEIIDYMTKKVKKLDKSEWIIYKDNKKIPPIIDEDIWNKANEKIKLNIKSNSINKMKNSYLKKIYCSYHNKPYYRKKFRRNNKENTWVCSEYLNKGKTYCNTANIRDTELQKIMKDFFYEQKLFLIFDILIKIYSKISKKKLEINEKIKEKEKIILMSLIDKILVKKINDIIYMDIYIKIKKEYQKEYIFERGYDTTNTSKYSVKYIVNYYNNKI